MKRILITGAQGFLGTRTALYFSSRYAVTALGHNDMDITRSESVATALAGLRPDIVIHCAAISDTGYAEKHRDESRAVNLNGTVHIAEACAVHGCKMIYMSSDQVYNGNRETGPLAEDIALQPVNVYGRHKLEAEREVTRIAPDAVGLRLTWMYDLPDSPYKLNSNLLVNLSKAHAGHNSVKAAIHEHRGITYVWDVVRRLESCFTLPGGIYNFGCENRLNSYDTFIRAAQLMGYAEYASLIHADNERFSSQPRNLSMNTARIRSHGIEFPDTIQGIEEALRGGTIRM